MSFKPQVKVMGETLWHGNALVFATRQEAEDSASDLAARWTMVTDWRATESDEPPNYTYIDGKLEAVK